MSGNNNFKEAAPVAAAAVAAAAVAAAAMGKTLTQSLYFSHTISLPSSELDVSCE